MLPQDLRSGFGIAGFPREFDQDGKIFDLPLQRKQGRNLPPQDGDFLDVLLRAFLIRPEIGLRHLAFEFAQARLNRGEVKDTSAARPRGISRLRH